MELWDILDKERNPTGRTAVRGNPLAEGDYHLVVHVWTRNSEGKFLISRRAHEKDMFPDLWETTGGSAITGEDSLTAVLREANEELGLVLDPAKGRLVRTIRRDYRATPDFLDVWFFSHEADLAGLKFQKEEVCDAKWADAEEIKKLFELGQFVPTTEYLHEFLDSISEGE
jgi:isopentenyldiphosphate isomerase